LTQNEVVMNEDVSEITFIMYVQSEKI